MSELDRLREEYEQGYRSYLDKEGLLRWGVPPIEENFVAARWSDQELMLWSLARGWTCRPDDEGWMWRVHEQDFLVELPGGPRGHTAHLPIINAQVRELMIGHLMLLGWADREGNRTLAKEEIG